MRLVFAGTPEFAARALERLHGAGHRIALVLTQPDRPAGRGMQLQASPVKQVALRLGLPVAQPRSLRLDGRYPDDAAAARDALAQAGAQVMVVAAYGLILPQWVLDAMRSPQAEGPGLGCLNIHASLLPRWRGAAPIHRAIEAGDAETGVTIMQMDAGLDTGDMLLLRSLPIRHGAEGAHRAGGAEGATAAEEAGTADTTGILHDRLAALGAELIVEALAQAEAGTLHATPQPAEGVTYAHKVDKAQARLDWALDAAALERRVRAFDPAPGAWTAMGHDVLKVWRAQAMPLSETATPGTVRQLDAEGITVACGQGALRLLEVQRAGGKRMPAAAFARGGGLRVGDCLVGTPGAAA